MKNIVSIFIGFIILITTFHKSIVFAFYEIKKDYVIEQLCVNRNIKNSCCFGKCFIEKQTSEKEAKGIIINLLKNIKEDFFIENINIAFNSESSTQEYMIELNQKMPNIYVTTIFHPPILST